jgi:hypothetical protein
MTEATDKQPQMIDALAASVDQVVAAALSAESSARAHALPIEDVEQVSLQARKAQATTGELRQALFTGEPVGGDAPSVLLHRINNQLTGALCVALLARDDLEKGHPCRVDLDLVESQTRMAAAEARTLAELLKDH